MIDQLIKENFPDEFIGKNEHGFFVFKDGLDAFDVFKRIKGVVASVDTAVKKHEWIWIKSGFNSYADWLRIPIG